MSEENSETRTYRTLFLSDIHLGTKNCQAEYLLEFLKEHEADTYYLVGDIIDFWRIRNKPHWPQSHNDVMQKLLRKVRKGARLVFIPGNHDEALRDYTGHQFGGIEIERSAIYETLDGKKYIVLHGDEFDVVVRYAKWLALLGDWAYETALWVNLQLNRVRRKFGLPYWSLSAWLKHKVKKAVSFIGEYETALASEAKRQEVDGVICGHIHHATIRELDEITYINTGDWVESCTAIAETEDGEMILIDWLQTMRSREAQPSETPGPVENGKDANRVAA
jgi:UDP-2,3-diacylglucosamine pyrophosphatase LpxH